MGLKEILNQIDTEIAQLQRARFLLAGGEPKRRGRKPGSKNVKPAEPAKKKRTMSAEARKRIADAAKKRWAEKRKAAVAK